MKMLQSELLESSLLFGVSVAALMIWERKKKQPFKTSSERLVLHLSSTTSSSRSDDESYWNDYTDADEVFVQNLPKIELHVHLDGSFDPELLYEYLQKDPRRFEQLLPASTDLPWEGPGRTLAVRSLVQECPDGRAFRKLVTCRGYQSLPAMLTCFQFVLPIVENNDELLTELAFDFCRRQWEQNIVYTEVRYSPHTLSSQHPERVYQAVTRGLRRGQAEFGITVQQILCAINWRPDWAMSTLELVRKHQFDHPCAAVGVDIAAGEEHFDETSPMHQAHKDMLQKARKWQIPITLHAGEVAGAGDNVRMAIQEYGAVRIGHGYRMTESTELMELVKESGCHVEVCPTSSDETGGWSYEEKDWTKHPCCIMHQRGIPFSLHSDDPAVFHTSLAWQYRTALAKMKLPRQVLVDSNLAAIDAAFGLDSSQKERLRKIVLDYASSNLSSLSTKVSKFADRVYVRDDFYL